MAIAGQVLAAISEDDKSLRLFDLRTASPLHDLKRPGREVKAVLANPTGDRLLTIESVPREQGAQEVGPPPPGPPRQPEYDLEFLLWDLNRLGEPIKKLTQVRGELLRRGPPMAAFSPDGRTLALYVPDGASTTAVVSLYETGEARSLGELDTQAEMLSALALGANNVMATASGSTIQLWDREGSKFLTSLSTRGVPWLMRFNARGNVLVAASGTHLELWDVSSRKILAVLPSPDWISDLCFAPEGSTLAVGGRTTSTAIWRIADPSTRVQLGLSDSGPNSLAFGPQGMLAIGTADGNVLTYREGRNHCHSTEPGSSQSAAGPASGRGERDRDRSRRASVSFDAEGRLIAHDARGLRIWNEGTGITREPTLIDLPTASPWPWWAQASLTRSTGGRRMVLVRDSDVLLWSADRPNLLRAVTPPPRDPNESPQPQPPRPPGGNNRGGEGRPRDGRPPGPPSRANVFAVQLDSDGKRLYVLGDFNHLQVWSLEPDEGEGSIQARRLALAEPLPEEFSTMALRPDGGLLALGDRYGRAALLDTQHLRIISRLTLPEQEMQGMMNWPLAFSPDGRRLAMRTSQGTIVLWDLSNPRSPRIALRLPGQRGFDTRLAFDALGHRLASSTARPEPVVEIWNLEHLDRELAQMGLPH